MVSIPTNHRQAEEAGFNMVMGATVSGEKLQNEALHFWVPENAPVIENDPRSGSQNKQKLHVRSVLPYQVSYTNMEGLRELRGMVVFPTEETTQGYSCRSTDYADYTVRLAYTTFYARCLMRHTNYSDYEGKTTYT